MSHHTAKYILNRHGLSCFNIRELCGLLNDRYMPLPDEVKQAILTLRATKAS